MTGNETAPAFGPALEAPDTPKQTRWQQFWRLFRQNRMAILGMIIFIAFLELRCWALLSPRDRARNSTRR